MKAFHPGLGVYPEIAEFTAKPDTIRPGDSVTLSWQARGAVSVMLEAIRDSDGTVIGEMQRDLPPVGSLTVHPKTNTTWRMRCQTVFSGESCEAALAQVEVKGTQVPGSVTGGF